MALVKLIHRIWLGDEPRPAEAESYGRQLAVLNPGTKVVDWTDKMIQPFGPYRGPRFRMVNEDLFDAATDVRERSDILRLELLRAYGGTYVDMDVEPKRGLEGLNPPDAFLGWEDDVYVCNAVIGATEAHPFIMLAIEELRRRCTNMPDAVLNERTGPVMLTAALHEAWRRGIEVRAYPPEIFYPYHHTELHRRGESFSSAYMVHHWNSARVA